MAGTEFDKLDSQLLVENVTFLDDCFDSTFVLQNSLPCVREYVTEVQLESSFTKNKVLKNVSSSSASYKLDTSVHSSISTQYKENSRLLKNWGLPEEITRRYEERGITQMFDWQVSCLGNSKVLMENSNLVYSAPTSAGKTLVAEIIAIKTLLERQKKVIIILPFVSIVREKMFYLQDILSSSGIRVEGFMGSQSPPGGLQAVHVAICTIEKANSLMNRLLEENNISELGAIIVDELHLLGDPHRGYILELLLTKTKYISSKLNLRIQIVGMSATLPNLQDLAKWLDAELFITDFRPIPLNEFCLIGNKLYDKYGTQVSSINTVDSTIANDNILNICLETIKDGCSILIFCMTKNRCESLAQNIASSFYKLGCSPAESGLILRQQLKTESILEVLEQLKNCPVGLDQILKNVISFGVAYHHAGLTFDERDIIEGAFKSGALRVLVATSTLSSGVNLPARKVIIRSPMFQRQPINILAYNQMIGRAGRMGKDIKGESILICTEGERIVGFALMLGALEPVKSCINSEDKYMRSMLEMIASGDVCTRTELELYSNCTLLYSQNLMFDNFLLDDTLKELINFELIRTQSECQEDYYVATALGKACLSSSMAPNDGLSLFCELQKARQCLVLETDLHLIYLVTPYSVSNQWSDIDWLHLLTLWESLTKAMKRVGELVGVEESFIIRCVRNKKNLKICPKKLNIHKRFYTALALQDLVNEVPLSEVANKFQCPRGFLQGLQQAAATFAGMVTAFCRQLGWKNMEMLISQFQDRLHFGIHSELIELIKLPSLNSTRARALFDAGFVCISDIASADINCIENVLHKAVPFQSEKKRDDDDDIETRKRNNVKNIWITGCCGVTAREAANILILEARKYLKQEIGVAEIKWDKEIFSSKTINSTSPPIEKNVSTNLKSDTEKVILCDEYKQTKDSELDTDTLIMNSDEHEKKSNLIGEGIISNFERTSKGDTNEIKQSESLQEKDVVCKSSMSENSHFHDDNKIKKEITHLHLQEGSNKDYCPRILDKDEIFWESLSFTDTAIDNISKAQSSAKFFSPNISFGEIEVKPTSPINNPKDLSKSSGSSIKDVSLFSSDSESSFLEESFPVKAKEEVLDKSILEYKKTPDDNIANDCTNSNANAVNSEHDDDIKLIYDEENDIFDEFGGTYLDNEVLNTQEIENISVKNNFISPFKRPSDASDKSYFQSAKKKKKVIEVGFPLTWLSSLHSMDLRHMVMKFTNHTLHCYILRECDILKIENFFDSDNLAAMITEMEYISPAKTTLIGSKVLKNGTSCEAIPNRTTAKTIMKAIAICFGHNLCFYFDLASCGLQLKSLLSKWLRNKTVILRILSLKSNHLNMELYFQNKILARCSDIALTEWLIDSDTRISNIYDLALKYYKLDVPNMEVEISNEKKLFKDLKSVEQMCFKAWCIFNVGEQQHQTLLQQYKCSSTLYELEDIETHVLKILAYSERRGITVDKNLASKLLIDVKKSQEVLQRKAFAIVGYHFNFNSLKSVAKVLGMYKGRKISTKRSVLAVHSSPLASIVIFWRKLNSILTKTLYPLTEKACIYSSDNRITPSYTMFTCTGRISMHEPNLQNVPRTFSVPLKYLTLKDTESSHDVMEFNCRNVFRAAPRHVLVSADYCQLEMRILTHYSADPTLTKIMSSDVDVFKSIASSWSGVLEEEVDDDLRQKAKQLCYGIIYGMGNRTLAQHLDVTEAEAAVFMDAFYKTYPTIRVFIDQVLEACRRTGYVETLKKRRRYLPDINSHVTAKRRAAERQAINTMIQGSAADIAKAAMCAIDMQTSEDTNKANLVLQMHDELIYEVPEDTKYSFITIIKEVMERTISLKVPLPVKVKCGYTWGSLEEVRI